MENVFAFFFLTVYSVFGEICNDSVSFFILDALCVVIIKSDSGVIFVPTTWVALTEEIWLESWRCSGTSL